MRQLLVVQLALHGPYKVVASHHCLLEFPGEYCGPLSIKKNATLVGGVALLQTSKWWSRRESNPRPQILYNKFYILSCVI